MCRGEIEMIRLVLKLWVTQERDSNRKLWRQQTNGARSSYATKMAAGEEAAAWRCWDKKQKQDLILWNKTELQTENNHKMRLKLIEIASKSQTERCSMATAAPGGSQGFPGPDGKYNPCRCSGSPQGLLTQTWTQTCFITDWTVRGINEDDVN